MKKIWIAISMLAPVYAVQAQISQGGLPLQWSVNEARTIIKPAIPVYYQAPDIKTFLAEEQEQSQKGPGPYLCGKRIPVDLSFPRSGTMTQLPDGRKIWTAQVDMGQVPGLLFYYDHFALPEGVRYYITNANNRQVLGAYTAANNSRDGLFATQEVQGGIVNFEIDMDRDVDPETIKWHINEAAVMFRGAEHLKQYSGNDVLLSDQLLGSSSVCEINAICPQGANYPSQRKATARIVAPTGNGFLGLCSGTLLNNTKADCKPYFLTASHCEETSSMSSSTFSQWLFYFNFETPDCSGTGNAPDNQTMTGASFAARSIHNTIAIGDFLLLKLNQDIPAAYGVYLAGWDRSQVLPTQNTTYIGFHHPAGDVKKLSKANNILSDVYNQIATPDTHWLTTFTEGGAEGGSSGSGLFDVNGRLVGDLTGGLSIQACPQGVNALGQPTRMGNVAMYSKFDRNWAYPESNDATNQQLQPWLDPNNTGAVTTNAIASSSCNGAPDPTGINSAQTALEQAVALYPNPVVNGVLRIKINMRHSADLQVSVYDITGSVKGAYRLRNTTAGDYSLNMNGYANGAYLVRINNGHATISRKVMIQHQ
ncbi:T9SS type A sorting domain-containing protein [Taibaiella koreensis]|uniref:T9SS type A sorting domain-containing protein n=1 Tax=Taibaiella koreensis TaxID=1268548 RepID=UPI0013C32858|nr:T9SS type A sorting domain-containing protein [Taibaiella koreensis]